MDKQVLVKVLDKLFAAFSKRGWEVTAYRPMPAYPGYRSLPLIVGVAMPSMADKSISERVSTTVPVLRQALSRDDRNLVSGLLIYSSADEMNHDMDEREGVGRPVVEPYWPY